MKVFPLKISGAIITMFIPIHSDLNSVQKIFIIMALKLKKKKKKLKNNYHHTRPPLVLLPGTKINR